MADERVERRLAAILVADMVGYSRLVESDEAGIIVRQKGLHTEAIGPAIADHGGRIVKTTGDGFLAEFGSAVAALQCAVEIQRSTAQLEAILPEEERMAFRIGVNLGDIIIDGDDILGDGVNVAARLEALAAPGGVCLSSEVHRQVDGKIDLSFEDMGEQSVKNLTRPVRAYRVIIDSDPAGAADRHSREAPALELPDKPSIAVLPFDNMSGDPEQEYFADGIAEDIITALSRFRWFFVIARNSSFTYRGKAVDVKQVARELGVRYVLEGSVRKAGNRVRITGQLIDAASGSHIWAERYDRNLDDIFNLQDEITESIVGAVEPELAGAERSRSVRKPPESLGAWDLYQRGMWHTWRFTKRDGAEAMRCFKSAVALDPGFGAAQSGLGLIHFYSVLSGWAESPAVELDAASRAIQEALAIDEKDAFAHLIAGRIHTLRGEFDTAIAEIDRSHELNPNSAMASYALGWALCWSGRAEEAQPHFDRAIRQSPNDPSLWAFEMFKGASYFWTGQLDSALFWLGRSCRHPNREFWTHANLAVVLAAAGRLSEAREALSVALEKRPELTVAAVDRKMLRHLHQEYKASYLTYLRKAGMPEK